MYKIQRYFVRLNSSALVSMFLQSFYSSLISLNSIVLVLCIITGPPNGPVLFCLLTSVVCNAAGGRRVGGRAADTARGPVRLRPVRATPCFKNYLLAEF